MLADYLPRKFRLAGPEASATARMPRRPSSLSRVLCRSPRRRRVGPRAEMCRSGGDQHKSWGGPHGTRPTPCRPVALTQALDSSGEERVLGTRAEPGVGPSNSAAFRFMGLFKWHGLHCGRPLGVHPAVRLTGAAAEAWPSERRGGDPGVEFLLGAVSPVTKPGNGRVREIGGQVLEIPVFGWGEGGIAERVGEAPTDLDEVVEAQLMRNGVIVVGNYGGGELVREIPVQGEIGAGGAVVDFEELALRLQQVEPEIVGNLKQSGVLVRVGGHQAQGAQVVQQAGGIDR